MKIRTTSSRIRQKKCHATGSSDNGTSLPYEESHIGSSMHSYCESEESPSKEEVGEEDYKAMNQALSSPSVAWWQMRKKWQNTHNMAKFLGRMGAGGNPNHEEGNNIDSLYRLGNLTTRVAMDGRVVSHPIMLVDLRSIGYDTRAFDKTPFLRI